MNFKMLAAYCAGTLLTSWMVCIVAPGEKTLKFAIILNVWWVIIAVIYLLVWLIARRLRRTAEIGDMKQQEKLLKKKNKQYWKDRTAWLQDQGRKFHD